MVMKNQVSQLAHRIVHTARGDHTQHIRWGIHMLTAAPVLTTLWMTPESTYLFFWRLDDTFLLSESSTI